VNKRGGQDEHEKNNNHFIVRDKYADDGM
jgi:hypothetical protein